MYVTKENEESDKTLMFSFIILIRLVGNQILRELQRQVEGNSV